MPDLKPTQQAVVYAAKSTADERGSIPTQLEDGRKFAEREGLEVVGEYSEESQSAYSGNRGPELAAALDHAERIGGAVIVAHSDRLARGDGVKARHLVELFLEAQRRGISLRSVEDDSSLQDLTLAAVMGQRNTEDSRRKAAAVKAGHLRRQEAGKWHGGPVSYGLEIRYVSRDGGKPESELVPSPAEAPVLERIFSELAAGISQRQVAGNLARDGVPTRKGGGWHQGTIRTISTNPLYIGKLKAPDGSLIDAVNVQPVVDVEVWEEVQAMRRANARTSGHGGGRLPVSPFLFTRGVLRCHCGEAMVGRSDSNKYECLRRKRIGPDACSQTPIARSVIDSAAWSFFEAVALDAAATEERLSGALRTAVEQARGLRRQAEAEAQRAAQRLARVRGHFQDGKLDPEDWAEQRDELVPAHEAATAEVVRLVAHEERITSGEVIEDGAAQLDSLLTGIRNTFAGGKPAPTWKRCG